MSLLHYALLIMVSSYLSLPAMTPAFPLEEKRAEGSGDILVDYSKPIIIQVTNECIILPLHSEGIIRTKTLSSGSLEIIIDRYKILPEISDAALKENRGGNVAIIGALAPLLEVLNKDKPGRKEMKEALSNFKKIIPESFASHTSVLSTYYAHRLKELKIDLETAIPRELSYKDLLSDRLIKTREVERREPGSILHQSELMIEIGLDHFSASGLCQSPAELENQAKGLVQRIVAVCPLLETLSCRLLTLTSLKHGLDWFSRYMPKSIPNRTRNLTDFYRNRLKDACITFAQLNHSEVAYFSPWIKELS